MKTTIDMAREAGFIIDESLGVPYALINEKTFVEFNVALERLVELARADERWEQSKRRGVLAFCPYTGRPRHPSDIASDPHGILILVPDQPPRGEKP